MTDHFQTMVDAAVLMLVDLPIEERPDMMTKVGVEFENCCEENFPTWPRSTVIAESRRFAIAVLSRVKEIATSNSGAVGSA